MAKVVIVITDTEDGKPTLTIASDEPTVPTAAQLAAALAVDCIHNLIRKESYEETDKVGQP
jgi:hypothetical protein